MYKDLRGPTHSMSPRAHLHVGGGVAVYVFDINQPSLPTPVRSDLASVSTFMALSTVFNFINSPDDSPLSHPVLFGSFNCISLYESLLQP